MLRKQHPAWQILLYSKMTGTTGLAGADVLVVDAMGLMGEWYSLADVALVGGSLFDGVGGHNVMEPALLGCVPLHGPYNENGQHLIEALRAVDPTCIRLVSTPGDLAAAVLQVLSCVDAKGGEPGVVQSAARVAAQQVARQTCAQLAAVVAKFVMSQRKSVPQSGVKD